MNGVEGIYSLNIRYAIENIVSHILVDGIFNGPYNFRIPP